MPPKKKSESAAVIFKRKAQARERRLNLSRAKVAKEIAGATTASNKARQLGRIAQIELMRKMGRPPSTEEISAKVAEYRQTPNAVRVRIGPNFASSKAKTVDGDTFFDVTNKRYEGREAVQNSKRDLYLQGGRGPKRSARRAVCLGKDKYPVARRRGNTSDLYCRRMTDKKIMEGVFEEPKKAGAKKAGAKKAGAKKAGAKKAGAKKAGAKKAGAKRPATPAENVTRRLMSLFDYLTDDDQDFNQKIRKLYAQLLGKRGIDGQTVITDLIRSMSESQVDPLYSDDLDEPKKRAYMWRLVKRMFAEKSAKRIMQQINSGNITQSDIRGRENLKKMAQRVLRERRA
jgi:hypothetical protein